MWDDRVDCSATVSSALAPERHSSSWVETQQALECGRGAEHGDVGGPLVCRLALCMVAAEVHLGKAEQQIQDRLP